MFYVYLCTSKTGCKKFKNRYKTENLNEAIINGKQKLQDIMSRKIKINYAYFYITNTEEFEDDDDLKEYYLKYIKPLYHEEIINKDGKWQKQEKAPLFSLQKRR